jgi:glycine cleavage system regulatory protein
MQISLVMTVIGADKPGLVDAVSSRIVEFGGNWVESRMCRLGGKFAGIVRAVVAEDKQAALAAALKSLEKEQGLAVVIETDTESPDLTSGKLVTLEVVGQDRPGIVSQISAILARNHVNVEEFDSNCESGAWSGEILFRAKVTMYLPEKCDVPALRKDLEKIAEDLMVDLNLEDN